MTEPRHCDFCGKSQDEVSRLVAGNSAYICNECVELVRVVVAAGGTQEQRRGGVEIARLRLAAFVALKDHGEMRAGVFHRWNVEEKKREAEALTEWALAESLCITPADESGAE